MMKYWMIVLAMVWISCDSPKKPGENNPYPGFPLGTPEENSLVAQWEKKVVLDSILIDDMESEGGWQKTGIGEVGYTSDRAKNGKRSLRFQTQMRDTAFYMKNRTEWNSLDAGYGGVTSIIKKFNVPQDWSAFNRISFWVYVHPTAMPTYCLHLEIKNHGTVAGAGNVDYYALDLKPGMWNHVLFEMTHLQRDKVIYFRFGQELFGHNHDDEGIVTYDIDQLEIQQVEPDHYEGWNVAPGKFSYSHVGYRPKDPKISMVGDGGIDNFQLIDQNSTVVYSGSVKIIKNKNGVFNQLNFSEFNKEGIYRIRCGPLESNPFPINDNIWLSPVLKAVNFYFCERCGYHVPGIHTICHKDWRGFHGDVKKIINGGWHDAGDYSQGAWRTSMACFAMTRYLEVFGDREETHELADRIVSEIAWGLEWLLKTHFGNGYHMSFSVMRIYTDNKIGTIDDVLSPAENIPWENFLAAAVECKASGILKKSHADLAGKARVAAIEDWDAAMNSRNQWDEADYREAAWGVISSLVLGEMTGEEKYNEQAVHFGNLLVRCQEQDFKDGIPITGYFYTTTKRQHVIHNLHTGFDEALMIALSMLCKSFPEHENWMDWYSSVVLYSEFFLKHGSVISSPYNHLPNSIFKRQEFMDIRDEQRRNEMLLKFSESTPLGKDYVIRTFPFWGDNDVLKGSTNIQMSGTWALAEAANLRNDSAGMSLAGKQLQWILGNNPFCQSLMYGVGYDFSSMHAVRLRNIVGSLPVGMDSRSGDKPIWTASNGHTTYKEIWIEPVSRFLGAVSVYASPDQNIFAKNELSKDLQITAKTIKQDNGVIAVIITLEGTGKHVIEIKAFNAMVDEEIKQVELSARETEKIQFTLNIADRNKPWVAVVSVDKNHELLTELLGSSISTSIQEEKNENK